MIDERPARPGPLRWLWYAQGGSLPPRYREWVLRDLTTSGWRWRQVLRSLVQASPVAVVVLLVVPGPLWVRLLAVGGGVFVALIYVVAFLDESTEHRALKAGYPRGRAQAVRDAARAPERDAAARRYAERYRRSAESPTDGDRAVDPRFGPGQ